MHSPDALMELQIWRSSVNIFFCSWRDSPPPIGPGPHHSQGFYITHNDASQSVDLLWTSDQLVAETSPDNIQQSTTDIHAPLGFEPTILADELPQTYALDRSATGTDV